TTFTTLGSHKISADYTSNNTDNFKSSSSSEVKQQVNAAPTVVFVSSSHSTTEQGQSVTFTATVNASPSTATPTGSVTFVIDGGIAAVVGVNGSGQASFSTSGL